MHLMHIEEQTSNSVTSPFETVLARFCGAHHCISVSSSQEALALALMAIGLQPGDEVITSPFSGSRSASVIASLGGIPVFVDIDRSTCNIDTALLEGLITSKTRAIVPTSLFGQPADMEQINAIAKRNDVVVIEDAAESFGATYKGKRSCNLSTIGYTGFANMDPLISSAGGGAVFTSDDRLAMAMREIVRRSSQHVPMSNGSSEMGGALASLSGSLATTRVITFDHELMHRQSVKARYDSLFCGRIDLIGQARDRTNAHAQYVVLLDDRDRLLTTLQKIAKSVSAFYSIPVSGFLQPGTSIPDLAAACPVAVDIEKKFLSLPMTSCVHPEFAHHLAATLLRAAGLWVTRPIR